MRIKRLSATTSLLAVIISGGIGVAAPAGASTTSPSSPLGGTGRTVAPAATPTFRAMGVVPSPVRVLPRTRKLRFAVAGAVVPGSVDLTTTAVTPGNQGQYGSCAAYAVGYALAGWYARTGGQYGVPFEPMYLYSQTHVNNTASGGGSYIHSNLRILASQGIAEKATYSSANPSFRTKPTATQMANAAHHVGSGYSVLFSNAQAGSAGIEALKAALAAGSPVVISIPVYTPFNQLSASNDLMTDAMRTGPLLGYHAITAMGYSERGLVIQNSWGTYWGKSGFATLAWDFVASSVREAYTMPAGLTGRTALPVVTKVTTPLLLPGTPLTVSGTNFAWVDSGEGDAVRLINTATGEATEAPVTSRTTASLTVTVPELEHGSYRVAVTGPGGTSADTAADDVRHLPPTVSAAVATASVPAAGKAPVSVTGGPFGTSAKAFAARKMSFTVNGVKVAAVWVNNSTLRFVAPAGKPGSSPTIQMTADGRPAAVSGTLTYGASMTAAWSAAKTGVRTGTVSGKGLLQSGSWQVAGPSSTVSLPVLPSAAALAQVPAGVFVASDTRATVKLPASLGAAGTWKLSFTPNATLYPGATLFSPVSLTYAS